MSRARCSARQAPEDLYPSSRTDEGSTARGHPKRRHRSSSLLRGQGARVSAASSSTRASRRVQKVTHHTKTQQRRHTPPEDCPRQQRKKYTGDAATYWCTTRRKTTMAARRSRACSLPPLKIRAIFSFRRPSAGLASSLSAKYENKKGKAAASLAGTDLGSSQSLAWEDRTQHISYTCSSSHKASDQQRRHTTAASAFATVPCVRAT